MLPSEELEQIYKEQMKIVDTLVVQFFSDLQKSSPVATGAFRQAWDIDKVKDAEWKISNNMEYATILFDGRRMVGGRYFGSEQWAEGGYPMLEKLNRELERRLK